MYAHIDSFESFQAGLLKIPREYVEDGLTIRTANDLDFLHHIITRGGSSEDKDFAERQVTLCMVAHTGLNIVLNKARIPQHMRAHTVMKEWSLMAGRLITRHIELNPGSERLSSSVFFSSNQRTLDRLHDRTRATTNPSGAYHEYDLAAGVARREVNVLPAGYRSLPRERV
jgi:hypothetical protein